MIDRVQSTPRPATEPMRPGLPGLLAAALALTGCGGGQDGTSSTGSQSGTQASTQTQPAPSPSATTFAVYLARDERVSPVRRTVAATNAVARAALSELLTGATAAEAAAGLTTAIPAGTTLRDVTIANETATVDLSRDFESGGGSSSMLTRVAQVVYTVTQFSTVRRIAFRLGGKPVSAIGGEGVVVDPPVTRADFEGQTPAILVESPLPGDEVSSPVHMRGTADTFEANVVIEVRTPEGKTLARTFTTATSGNGVRGTFETNVRVDSSPGPFVLAAFEASAMDGTPLHLVGIPLSLRP